MTDPASLGTLDVLTEDWASCIHGLWKQNFMPSPSAGRRRISASNAGNSGRFVRHLDVRPWLQSQGDRVRRLQGGSRFGKVGCELVERRGIGSVSQARTYLLFAHFLIPYNAARPGLHVISIDRGVESREQDRRPHVCGVVQRLVSDRDIFWHRAIHSVRCSWVGYDREVLVSGRVRWTALTPGPESVVTRPQLQGARWQNIDMTGAAPTRS